MVGNEEVGGQGKYGKPDLTLSERFDFHTSFGLSGQPGSSIYGYRAEAEAVLPRPPNPIKSLAFLLLIQLQQPANNNNANTYATPFERGNKPRIAKFQPPEKRTASAAFSVMKSTALDVGSPSSRTLS